MVRYEAHAQLDGTSILHLLHEMIGMQEARWRYLLFDADSILDFEFQAQDQIAEFLAKTEGQRPAFCRRIFKNWDRTHQAAFLVLCFLAAERVARLILFRDYAGLEPGGSFRATTARIYAASQRMDLFVDYDWPSAAVFNLGLHDGGDDEDVI